MAARSPGYLQQIINAKIGKTPNTKYPSARHYVRSEDIKIHKIQPLIVL